MNYRLPSQNIKEAGFTLANARIFIGDDKAIPIHCVLITGRTPLEITISLRRLFIGDESDTSKLRTIASLSGITLVTINDAR